MISYVQGSGTRKGNGQCVCDKGYTGDLCHMCAASFYESYKDEKKVLCTPCHMSCKDSCTQAGPKGCLACNDGWVMDTELGCNDVDECIMNREICPSNAFCVNSPGSHTCISMFIFSICLIQFFKHRFKNINVESLFRL